MKKQLIVVALFATIAVAMVMLWSATRDEQLVGPDRNVPGATTGEGKNSLAR
jgi:hypothetical protein